MEGDLGSRGVLVHTAGFVLGSLGLLLSIITSTLDVFLGRDALVALTHTLAHTDTETQELRRNLHTRRSPSGATSPIPSISVTLHQTGNSISHSMRGTRSLAPPKLPSPPRRSSVSFAPAPAQPKLSSQRSSPALKEPHWLSLPPIQTRSSSRKGGRRPTLNRARSSPQLTSFAAAGVSFSSFPAPPTEPSCEAQAQKKGRRKDGRKYGTVISVDREEWQSVYLSEEGSPNIEIEPATAVTPDGPELGPAATSTSTPQRPTLRKARTLTDLLRRVPSSPGPPLPINPQTFESTAKKAFAFTSSKSKSKLADTSASSTKDPKFSVGSPEDACRPSSWRSKGSDKEKSKSKERKRTSPYEAPYFWIPPDKAAAMAAHRKDSSDSDGTRGRKISADGRSGTRTGSGTIAKGGPVKSAPTSRAVSPVRISD